MRADLLAPLERGVTGPCPRCGVVRLHHRGAPLLDASIAFDELELHLVGERYAILHRHLIERAGDRALHAGTVVAPDPHDHRIVELAQLLDRVDNPADVVVGVLRVAGVDLHLARVVGLEPVRHVIPGRERIIARCQFRVRRYDTECLLPSEYLLAKTVPPLIELALVLAGPGGGDMVRSMAAPGSEV